MVLVDSPGVPRVPGYSGAGRATFAFAYGAITRYGRPFQVVLLAKLVSHSGPTTPTGPKPCRFRLFPLRSPLLRESRFLSLPPGTEMFQFPGFASYAYVFSAGYRTSPHGGFPHSDIPGSLPVGGSPRLFAAYHVLHRLLMPRHSP